MGSTEEFRKRQGESTKSNAPEFKPDPDIEACLRRDVAVAQRNLDAYLKRLRDFQRREYQVKWGNYNG